MPQLPDPKELVSSMGRDAMRARVQATTSIADNADDAARAVQVEGETGIPAGALLDNPELEQDHRAALTADIVDNNHFLQDYINAHPLAAKVSNDDWGSLDEASQRIEEAGHRPILGQFVEGFKEGFGGTQLGEWMLKDPRGQEFLEKHPNLFLAAAGVGGLVELPAKIFSGGLEGAHYAMREFLQGAGMDESHAESLSRELTALVEYKAISPETGPKKAKPEAPKKAEGPAEEVAGIEPYVRAGEEPPYGVSEETDKIHEEQLAHDQQAVDAAVKAVQGTATANRSPEMASVFMGVHTDTPVLIPVEAFEKIFGDDIPPDLIEEWSAQKQVGGYVSVPFKELVKLDPEVLKELKDSIQYRENGPSKEDVEVAKEAKKVVEEPEAVRFFHGADRGSDPTAGGGRWVTSDKEYARKFRADVGDKDVYYVDIPKGDPTEIAARAWDEFDTGTNMEGRYNHIEIPESWAKKLKLLGPDDQATESVRKAGGLETPKVLQDYKEGGEGGKPPEGGEEPPETTLRTPIFGQGALGLPKTQVDRLQRLIDQRNQEDMERALAKAKTAARKEQEPEWKEKWRENAKAVEQEFNAKPEVRAYKLLLGKVLGTAKITKKYTLDPNLVDPVVKAGLPDRFFAKSGKVLTSDQLADLVGAPTGKELMQDLAAITSAIGDEPWMDAFQRGIRDETTRRTREQMGDLAGNILESAKDHALGLTQMDLLHEDTVAMGMLAEAEMPYEKSEIRGWIKGLAGDLPMQALKADRFLKATGQLGKLIEIALAKKKFAEAFKTAQTREYNALLAREAKRIEKERDRFDATAERYRKPVKADSPITGEAADMIHAVLIRLGKSVDRSVQQIQDSMTANGHKSLQDFIEKKQAGGEIAEFPKWLFSGEPQLVGDMKYGDFKDAHEQALKQLVSWGKKQKSDFIGGVEIERQRARDEMIEEIAERPTKSRTVAVSRGFQKAMDTAKKAMVSPIQPEFFFERLGPSFNKYMTRDLAEGINNVWQAWRDYGKKFKPLEKDSADWWEKIPNTIFKNPVTGEALKIDRSMLRVAILNMGNPDNFKRFVEGWKLNPDEFRTWVQTHSTKEDWDWAQRAGKIFREAGRESQKTWGRQYGYQWDFIDTPPVETPFGVKDGWYAPIIKDAYYEKQYNEANGIHLDEGALFQDHQNRVNTPDGHTKDRTQAVYPMTLDIRRIPGALRTQLYDTYMREAVINFNSFLKDTKFRNAIIRSEGKHWVDMLDAYIKNVANYPIDRGDMLAGINNAGINLVHNTVGTLILFGAGTVLKHGPTAGVLSARSIGGLNFARAFKDVWLSPGGADIRKFIEENSGEIARRSRAYEEQLFGAFTLSTIGERKMELAARKYREWGSAAVAFSDNLSSKAQWWHEYNRVLDDTGQHGTAVYEADKSVRFSHGSTAITSRPVLMQSKNAFTRSFVALYGFFNDLLNRSYRAAWQARDSVEDSYDLFRAGAAQEGWTEAKKGGKRALADIMALAVAPAIIEELVSPSSQDEDEPLSRMLAHGMFHTVTSQVPFVREIADGMLHNRVPRVGMLGSTYDAFFDIYRDLRKVSDRDAQDHLENLGSYVQHATTGLGILTGIGSRPVGNAAKYWINVAQGIEDTPEGPWEALTGTRFGTTKRHAKTLDEYTSSWPGKVLRPDKWGTE